VYHVYIEPLRCHNYPCNAEKGSAGVLKLFLFSVFGREECDK